jgi:hypothetical protein
MIALANKHQAKWLVDKDPILDKKAVAIAALPITSASRTKDDRSKTKVITAEKTSQETTDSKH